jgi:hypothetical protein
LVEAFTLTNSLKLTVVKNNQYFSLLKTLGIQQISINFILFIESIFLLSISLIAAFINQFILKKLNLWCIDWMWYEVFEVFEFYNIEYNVSVWFVFLIFLINFVFITISIFLTLFKYKNRNIIYKLRESL